MRRCLFIWLIMLPVVSYGQRGVFKKLLGLTSGSKVARRSDTAFVCQKLNTAVLFPKPPEFFTLTNTPVIASTFTVNACIKNVKSVEGIRLTLNGEEQTVCQQAPSAANETDCPNGYFFTCTLSPATTRSTVSLEARNEGGATIRYLEVFATK